jgi:DNA-binding transcriptional MerR regulator
MPEGYGKSDQAFRTISELASELGVPQHILRYWETRFPQLKPLQRAGNRRYYRPPDVELARKIHRLLNDDGYTIKGVQQLLARRDTAEPEPEATIPATVHIPPQQLDQFPEEDLRTIRRILTDALS